MNLLIKIAAFLLYVPPGTTGQAARFYIFQRIGYYIAANSHAIWAVVFLYNGITFLFWYNVVVSLMFGTVGLYAQRKSIPLWLLFILWFIEIPFHALLGTIYTGADTLFWIVPIASAVIAFLIYQLSWGQRSALTAAMVSFTFALLIYSFYAKPLVQITFGSEILLFSLNFWATLCGVVLYVGLLLYQVMVVERRLKREHDRADGLLKNILPDPIALRLKDGEHLIADDHPEVSVIFADIVNFTEASARLRPAQLVETLNIVFTEFDKLSARHGAEKIKTIGDAYMAVVGVPDQSTDHAQIAVQLALDMLATARTVSAQTHFPIDLRIGINSGPVVAGVIGESKFAYDLWGDAVNVAARMESHGQPGEILITQTTASLLPDGLKVTPAGMRDVKGKGDTPVFTVTA